MKIIKVLSEKIKEELNDAESYITLAMEWKKDERVAAALFAELSAEEMGHADELHTEVTQLISRYRQTQGEPPAGMLAIYEYLHEQQMENAMRVRVKQGMYKEAE
jgi:ferritin